MRFGTVWFELSFKKKEKVVPMKSYSVALLSLAFVAGCASGFVATDKGAYMASKTSVGGAFGDPQGLLADLYAEANQHCEKAGQAVETISSNPESGIPFVRPARAVLNFRCVAK
jgi:hypothetical protein